MSFQAYIDHIEKATKLTTEQIKNQAKKAKMLDPGLKATEFVTWLNKTYGLGRGHAMALWKFFIEKGWIIPGKGASKITPKKTLITVKASINLPINDVWQRWTEPNHIIHWNFASQDWTCPRAKNDLKKLGKFSYRMESKDGKEGFDFSGIYEQVTKPNKIISVLDDNRTLEVHFESQGQKTKVTEIFEAETMNSVALQKVGWQLILDQFKAYCEISLKEKKSL